ncbi:MAG TPA: hypothetical protein VFJ65_09345 [Solirubrobacterales bacterium]|nr:hypothetical protein [Solirubrobacterales bacterium]
MTDIAAEVAINAPTAKADFALAMAYRPILLFDHEEPVPWPLSIAALFNEGRVTLCHDQGVAKTECDSEPLKGPQELENNGTHLRLRLRDSHELRVLARSELKAAEDETEESPSTQVPGASSTITSTPSPWSKTNANSSTSITGGTCPTTRSASAVAPSAGRGSSSPASPARTTSPTGRG